MYGQGKKISVPRIKNKGEKSAPSPKKNVNDMSDAEYYKIHRKHHSEKHIKAMKALQRMGINRNKAHNFVKEYIGK
tara:strand:+ start:610 stop:837 length:228 start_codon:yes stop_codon:yes gene_type:complete